MTDSQLNEIQDELYSLLPRLRSAGFAIAVFSPEEIESVDRNLVEQRMVEKGAELIDSLAPSL